MSQRVLSVGEPAWVTEGLEGNPAAGLFRPLHLGVPSVGERRTSRTFGLQIACAHIRPGWVDRNEGTPT
jgi:uncharacterized protein (DUF302 family)